MTSRSMTQPASPSPITLKDAVQQNRSFSKRGLLERLFAAAFDTLVYPQIWEDPVVDMQAMEIKPHHRIVTIASGGCNVLSYLAAKPASIVAVDLNFAHVALTRLKLAAVRHLPAHNDFLRFFGQANSQVNEDLFRPSDRAPSGQG